MITKSDLNNHFADVQEMSNDVFKFSDVVPAFTDVYYLQLTDKSERQLLVLSRNYEDDAFASRLFKAAREMSSNPATLAKHAIEEDGDYKFTHAILAPANFHSYFGGILDAERSQVVLLSPIYNCEFAGDESVELFYHLRRHIIPTLDWQRQVTPRVMLRFDNPKTGGGTIGPNPFPVKFSVLELEIANLNGVEAGFIEMTSFRGDYAEILSPAVGQYTFRSQAETVPRQMTEQEARSETLHFLTAETLSG